MAVLVKNEMILLFLVMFLCGFCNCFVYKVGDSAGWAVIGNVDYNKWAFPKSFQVGDTFIFEYDPSFHNVLEVSRPDFHSCNGKSPIATYTSGNDSIVIKTAGHYYYICGFLGHCQSGQKVDLRVPKSGGTDGSPTMSPIDFHNDTTIPNASSVGIGPLAPGPSQSSGRSIMHDKGRLSLGFGLLVFLGRAF